VPKSSGAHAPPCRAARRKPRRIKSFYVYYTGSPRIVNALPASKPFMRAPARKRAARTARENRAPLHALAAVAGSGLAVCT
jgi:hypothetical protein